MSSSSSFFSRTNELISKSAGLFDLVARDDLTDMLAELSYNWSEGTFNEKAKIVSVLAEHGLINGNHFTRIGVLFLSRLLLHFGRAGDGQFGSLREKYKEFSVISSGKNSIVVTAQHALLGTKVVLKLVRPGASSNIVDSMALLSKLRADTSVVLPIDLVLVKTTDVLGKPITLPCLVFPFIEGITFRDFLIQQDQHLNSQVVISFARQMGSALRELEAIGAYHGDLHEGNILVDQHWKEGIRFKIVDISFDAMGSLPMEVCRNNDLQNFKQHIWRILSIQKSFMPGVSIRKYIGTQNYIRLMNVLSEETSSFLDVCRALRSDSENALYLKYVDEKARFIADRFRSPVSFRLQRYEEITDQTVAVRLFVPFEPLMEKIIGFSNVYVSGNRGSGKSTYLASLAFFPHAEAAVVDMRDTFGVYFPCRQGEFRALGTCPAHDRDTERAVITHVLVIKIVRRALEILAAGVATTKLAYPPSLRRLRHFVESFLQGREIVSVDHDIQTELENYVSTMVHVEMDEISYLRKAEKKRGDEKEFRSLLEFFTVVQETFGELASTRFHLLFDDAGGPYVPSCVQRAICDLILTSNSLFCAKLSAEKLTFEFESSDGKALENGQDYFEHDISQVLFIGSGSGGLNRSVLEGYFRRIVEQRLSYFLYKSTDIADYLGDEQITHDKLVKLAALGRKDAYYCGWTTVWNIADRTPRNLLELVSEIFSVGEVDRDSAPGIVSTRNQDRAIRSISEKRLESLSQLSGALELHGKAVSLGRQLFEVTTTIGSTFKIYLKSEARHERPRQHLAIERNDLGDLDRHADLILRRLITFGVLDSGKAGYARDDEIKKPFYVLNRIYCPAFGIGYRRDQHLRLSRGKLELLLMEPERFRKEGTRRLRDEALTTSRDLFWYGDES